LRYRWIDALDLLCARVFRRVRNRSEGIFERPKLDGLWVKLRYNDGETLEGVVPNDLLSLLDNGCKSHRRT